MKWKDSSLADKAGLTRICSGFAFLPFQIGREVRWLESVTWEEKSATGVNLLKERKLVWFRTRFVDALLKESE